MQVASMFNKKQVLLSILLVSLSTLVHAETYTSVVTTGEAWGQAWSPTSTPISRTVSGTNEVYTFVGDSSYSGKTTLINTTSQNVQIVAGSGSLIFNNWNMSSGSYLITGYKIDIASNVTFDNITGGVIRASGSSGGVGGADSFTVGNNVTISNVYSNSASTNYGGGIYIFGPNITTGQGVFGENFTVKNSVFEDSNKIAPFKGGAAIGVRRSMDLTFGNGALFENNKVRTNATSGSAQGGAISGVGNTENVTARNVFTFNGNASFLGNSAIADGTGGFAQGGAIALTRASGTPLKTGDVIFNGATGTVNISNNLADAKLQARGGAIFIGDGNLYIEAANIIIANNTTNAIEAGSLGGAIYTSTSDAASESRGNITIVGNAIITGNKAVSATPGASLGGAIYANGNVNLRPNASANTIVFRDNEAGEGAAIQLNLANRKLFLDYANGGTIEFYDRFNIRDGSQMFQSGNGITKIWSDSWGGNINIESGILSIEPKITMANTTNGANAEYGAGRLSGYNVNLGTVTSAMQLNIYDGASLYSGLTANGYAMNITSGNIINLYGSGVLNYDSSITDGFTHLGSDRVVNIGDSNSINLAARSVAQVLAGVYNTRGTDGSAFSALHLNNMGSGNIFTLNTDIANNTADKIVVNNTATGLNYIKVGYDPTIASGGNANGSTKTLVVEAGAGTSSAALQGSFTGAVSDMGIYKWKPIVEKDGDNWYIVGRDQPGPYTPPSTTVDISKSMANATLSILRLTRNDLLKRMGELRFNPNNAGVWTRMYTGESNIKDSGNQRYMVVQGGVDHVKHEKSGKRFTGLALEHISANNSFAAGSGKTNALGLAGYQVWMNDKGHYYDWISKIHSISNSMDIADTSGNRVTGDYRSWAYSTSFEYGFRKELGKGYFAIPQAELTYSRIMGASYTTSNNIDIHRNAQGSLMGRIGITLGRKYNNDSQVYITANVLREFLANARITAADRLGNRLNTSVSGKETWYNLAIGATIKDSKKHDWYMELERDFGSIYNNKWQILLGSRWSW